MLGGSDPKNFYMGDKHALRLKLFSLVHLSRELHLETFVSCVSGLSHQMLEMAAWVSFIPF